MKDIEYVLEFAADLGGRMLHAGANLERSNDTMQRVCSSYHLKDVSIYSLCSIIQISARTEDGDYAYYQASVPAKDTHLTRLEKLNRLSREVCRDTPDPKSLMWMLEHADEKEPESRLYRLAGWLVAIDCLCVLYGGTIGDIIATSFITAAMSWLLRILYSKKLNTLIVNAACMLFAGSMGEILVWIGLGQQFNIICISCSMMLIPGIGLTNAFRNLLCGNEMNGILEMLKALLEALAIVLGIVVSTYLFGGLTS